MVRRDRTLCACIRDGTRRVSDMCAGSEDGSGLTLEETSQSWARQSIMLLTIEPYTQEPMIDVLAQPSNPVQGIQNVSWTNGPHNTIKPQLLSLCDLGLSLALNMCTYYPDGGTVQQDREKPGSPRNIRHTYLHTYIHTHILTYIHTYTLYTHIHI